jgi:hypothetical protein
MFTTAKKIAGSRTCRRAGGYRCLVVAVSAAAMLASPARADEESDEKQLPTWEVGVGGSAFAQPDYVGSDEYRIRGIGFPWIIYRGEP